jgi:hypothetical protein
MEFGPSGLNPVLIVPPRESLHRGRSEGAAGCSALASFPSKGFRITRLCAGGPACIRLFLRMRMGLGWTLVDIADDFRSFPIVTGACARRKQCHFVPSLTNPTRPRPGVGRSELSEPCPISAPLCRGSLFSSQKLSFPPRPLLFCVPQGRNGVRLPLIWGNSRRSGERRHRFVPGKTGTMRHTTPARRCGCHDGAHADIGEPRVTRKLPQKWRYQPRYEPSGAAQMRANDTGSATRIHARLRNGAKRCTIAAATFAFLGCIGLRNPPLVARSGRARNSPID